MYNAQCRQNTRSTSMSRYTRKYSKRKRLGYTVSIAKKILRVQVSINIGTSRIFSSIIFQFFFLNALIMKIYKTNYNTS